MPGARVHTVKTSGVVLKYQQGGGGAFYERSWALPKRKCLIFGSLRTQFPASVW